MNPEAYPFKVGDFECVAIGDGTFTYEPPLIPPPADFLFANAPRILRDQVLRRHRIQPEKRLAFVDPFMCLMVSTGRYMVMVDTGAGRGTPKTGRFLQNLRAGGIGADDIDIVVLTQGHEDHVGGNTDAEGKPAFPKARYVMWKEEWTFWNSGQAEKLYGDAELVAFIRRNLLPVQHQMDLIDHEGEVLPGINAIAAPGHTPGHMAVSVSSNEGRLPCVADAFLHPIHIERPEWHTSFDMAPEQLIETRRHLLKKAATEKALILASHLPFPGLGHVVRRERGWHWEPIQEDG